MKSSFISPRRRRKNQRVPSDASTSTAQRGKSKKTSLILVKKKVSDRDLSSSRQKNRAPAVPPSLSTRLTSRREQHRSRRSTANINTPTSMMESSSRRMTTGGGGESKKYQSNDNTASSTRTGFNPFTDPFIDQSTDPLVDPFIDPHNSTKSSAKNHSTSKFTIHDDDRNYAYGQQEIPLENIVVLSTDEILTGDLSVDHNNASFPKMNANDDVEFNSAPSKGLQQQASKEEYSPHLPDNNLHQMIEDNDWEKLDSTLKLISSDQNYLLSEVCAISKVDASVLHACCWKAPVGLTLLIIKLLTINPDNIQNLFLLQDKDGNTPMHLCAANMMPFYDDKSKPIIDASVLDLLIAIVPQALIIQNKEGDTPLHLFVTSKAAAASVLSSFPPTANIAGATTRALSQILKNLSKEQDVIIKDKNGATPFHLALVIPAEESVLLALLDHYPNVCKVEDEHGMIPLHYVAAFMNTPISVVRKMVEIYQYGSCHISRSGDTPLHILVRNSADDVSLFDSNEGVKNKLLDRNGIEILQLLMGNTELSSKQHGKDLNKEYDPYFITNNESLTPAHCCALFNASLQICQILMSHPSANRVAMTTNDFGSTPLHLAASHPSASSDIALSVGTSECAMYKDINRRTPLHNAAQNKHATRALIECIARINVNTCQIVDVDGNTPLHLGINSDANDEVIIALLNAWPPAAGVKNKELNTPLHSAIKHNASFEVIKQLLQHYPNAADSPNEYGNLALHCATLSNSTPSVFEILLETCPESAIAQNNNGDCPLHNLVGSDSTSMAVIRLYLDVSDQSLLIKNNKGQSPLDKAEQCGAKDDILELLRQLRKDGKHS